MTWVSERSGMASSGMCRTHHTAPRRAAPVSSRTRTRFLARNSMMRSTIAPVLVLVADAARGRAAGFRLERPQRGAEARFRVDQEVRRDDDLFARGKPGQDLVEALCIPSDLNRTRLELTL